MIKTTSFLLFAGLLISCHGALAAPAKTTNYVEFYVSGNCQVDDCLNTFKELIDNDKPQIVSMNLDALAPRMADTYRKITISFKDLKTAPFDDVIQKLTSLSYQVVSYTIHDTHTGKDVILPHN